MFGIGTGELLLIAFIALLVLGPERMPQLMRDIGKAMTDLRRTSEDLQREFLDADKALSPTKILDAATRPREDTSETGRPAELGATMSEVPPPPAAQAPDAGATEAAVTTEPEPDETAFDREARLARERIDRAGRSDPVG